MRKHIKFFLIVIFIPLVLFLKLISPLIKIRWAKKYFSDRVGHLVAEMEHYLYLNKNKSNFVIDLFPKNVFYNKNPSNKFLQKHYRKKIVTVNDKILILLKEAQKIIEKNIKMIKFENLDEQLSTRDKFKIFKKGFRSTISFSALEKKIIFENLNKIGLKRSQKFVCIIIRDNKYLKEKLPHMDFSYHDYRDSKIESFRPGINYLLDKGYFVLRMGKSQKGKFKINNNNFYDYSASNLKSDLLDVWLMANCEFCLSTGTGLDQISRVFKKPILFINHLPLIDWSSHFKSLTHPKFLFDLKEKKLLNFEGYIKHSYFRKSEYDKNKIKIVDLNKKQILLCIKEFLELIRVNWGISKTRRKKQIYFNKIFTKYLSRYHLNIDFHKNIHKHALLSFNFLENKKTKIIQKI